MIPLSNLVITPITGASNYSLQLFRQLNSTVRKLKAVALEAIKTMERLAAEVLPAEYGL